jgi:hypothetical protein
MTESSLKLEIKINYPIFLGLTLLVHALLFVLIKSPESQIKKETSKMTKSPLKILSLGKKDSKSLNSVYLKPQRPSQPLAAKKSGPKNLNLADLMASPASFKPTPKVAQQPSTRPGQMPQKPSALSGLRYGAEEFKKMAADPMLQGGADILSSQKIALNFEVPEGKKRDELNESELKLYSFLRRGAIKYVNSLSTEIKEFEMKNPHLHFPLTENKQVLTGRLVYDGQGNLKQIKMVRWTNIDKLQNFFEGVLKRLDTLQNPPKELWIENGEFTVFVTLQING